MPAFRLPSPLRQYAAGETKVSVSGETVGTALTSLTEQHPDLRNHLFNGSHLRSFVNIYYNQEDIRDLDGMETEIGADALLLIVPSIAGG